MILNKSIWLRIRVDMGVTAMKGFSALSQTPESEPSDDNISLLLCIMN